MPKVWTDDTALMEGMTDNLFEALYKMPKYFLRIDDIAHSLGMPISSLLVLCVLREGKISIGEISERLCIAKPNAAGGNTLRAGVDFTPAQRQRPAQGACRADAGRRGNGRAHSWRNTRPNDELAARL